MKQSGEQHKTVNRDCDSKLQEPPAGWKFGILYVNPRDHRVWVPRRRGLQYGQTLNLGNLKSWLVLALLLLPALLAACIAVWASRLE